MRFSEWLIIYHWLKPTKDNCSSSHDVYKDDINNK